MLFGNRNVPHHGTSDEDRRHGSQLGVSLRIDNFGLQQLDIQVLIDVMQPEHMSTHLIEAMVADDDSLSNEGNVVLQFDSHLLAHEGLEE